MAAHRHDTRIDELAAAIGDCKRQLETLEAESRRLKDERATDLCEFKRGDRVMCGGKEYVVSRVVAGWSGEPTIHGWNVLKNGQAGNRESRLYTWTGNPITRKAEAKGEA